MKALIERSGVSRPPFHPLAGALLIALTMLPAAAEAHHYTITPDSCTPSAADVVSPKWVNLTDGSLGFAAGKTGVITLLCNIPNITDDGTNPADWTTVEITFQDSSTAFQEFVAVTLRQVNNRTGLATSESLLNSDAADPTSGWRTLVHTLTTKFDFTSNHYYVSLILWRSNTNSLEKILYVGF